MTDTEILDELQKAVSQSGRGRWDIQFGTIWTTLYPEVNLRLVLETAIKDNYARRVAKELVGPAEEIEWRWKN